MNERRWGHARHATRLTVTAVGIFQAATLGIVETTWRHWARRAVGTDGGRYPGRFTRVKPPGVAAGAQPAAFLNQPAIVARPGFGDTVRPIHRMATGE